MQQCVESVKFLIVYIVTEIKPFYFSAVHSIEYQATTLICVAERLFLPS